MGCRNGDLREFGIKVESQRLAVQKAGTFCVEHAEIDSKTLV